MKHGFAYSERRTYLAIEMNRSLIIEVDGERVELELASVEDGRKMRRFIKDQ